MEGSKEIINDTAKAQEMANASKAAHDYAAMEQRRADDESFVPTARAESQAKADHWEANAGRREDEAAMEYDIKKEAEGKSNEDIEALIAEAAAEQKDAADKMVTLRQSAAEHPEFSEAADKAKEEEIRMQKAGFRKFVLDGILAANQI